MPRKKAPKPELSASFLEAAKRVPPDPNQPPMATTTTNNGIIGINDSGPNPTSFRADNTMVHPTVETQEENFRGQANAGSKADLDPDMDDAVLLRHIGIDIDHLPISDMNALVTSLRIALRVKAARVPKSVPTAPGEPRH